MVTWLQDLYLPFCITSGPLCGDHHGVALKVYTDLHNLHHVGVPGGWKPTPAASVAQ
jgi:hypothetical protein